MNRFYSCLPSIHDDCGHQTSTTDITDEEFKELMSPVKFKWYHRLYQILCFFLFLGPIRFIISTTLFLFLMAVVYLIRIAIHSLGLHPDVGKELCISIARGAFRVLLFGFGVFWIKLNGKIDKEARYIISNYNSVIDPFVILIFRDITVVIKKELSRIRILKPILENVDPIYVDRYASKSASKQIIDRADDKTRFPVLFFPELTPNNGEAILKFHQNTFLTPYKVQPILTRYWTLGPKGFNTYSSTNRKIGEILWNFISTAPTIISIDALPSISMESEGKADIKTFTLNAQLIIANHLKVKAVSRAFDERPDEEVDTKDVRKRTNRKHD